MVPGIIGVGLAAAKTAAMRINLNIDGCGVVAPPVHSSLLGFSNYGGLIDPTFRGAGGVD